MPESKQDLLLIVAASAMISTIMTLLTYQIMKDRCNNSSKINDDSNTKIRKSTFYPKGFPKPNSKNKLNCDIDNEQTKVDMRSRSKSESAAKVTKQNDNNFEMDFRTPPKLMKKTSMRMMATPGKFLAGAEVDSVYLHEIRTLRGVFPSTDIPNVRHGNGGLKPNSYNKIMGHEDFILADIVRNSEGDGRSDAFLRAGPRSTLHFDPNAVRAAIVTCGGLCPGLNNVIRELTHALYYLYDVEHVMGIRGGYNGFSGQPGYEPISLTPESVQDCHHQGGTILASSRGGFDIEVIIDFLSKNGINQLYVIGGDGTHRGAHVIAEECFSRKMNVAVVGIPKTIDNDVDIIDRSFGFTTSVEAAQAAIISAKTEARCNMPNGIGIVKLMGRTAGFIAVHATLASGDVDLCLVPEVDIVLEGENGVLPYLFRRVKENGHAVVVVAEGAGEELLGQSAVKDAGGNRKLPPIGEFMKNQIADYFKKNNETATIKYLDPSYMIRSVAANASDSLYCMLLAHNAVHGAMAGYTEFSSGLVNNRMVYIPIPRLVATSPRVMDPVGRSWERVLSMTRQPQQTASFDHTSCTVNDRTML